MQVSRPCCGAYFVDLSVLQVKTFAQNFLMQNILQVIALIEISIVKFG